MSVRTVKGEEFIEVYPLRAALKQYVLFPGEPICKELNVAVPVPPPEPIVAVIPLGLGVTPVAVVAVQVGIPETRFVVFRVNETDPVPVDK